MSRLVVSSARSPRFWMLIIFFVMPLISTALLPSTAEESSATAQWATTRVPPPESWTPVPMDATTDGTIIVRKVAYPRNTAQTFTFSGDVAGTIPGGGTLTVTDVPAPGTYTSTESVPGGWQLRSIQCDDGSFSWNNTATFNLGVAETIECTFYNVENGSEPCRELTGRWPYGPSHALDVDGSTVFMGSGSALVSVDAGAPSSPYELDAIDLEQLVRGVEVESNQVFVTTSLGYDGSLVILDATNPSDLQYLGDVYLTEPGGVEVQGSYAYVASGGWDLVVVDVSDPSNPSIADELNVTGWAQDVSVSGNLAVLATWNAGITTVDITTPSAPFEIGSLDLGVYARSVDVAGVYAYVAAGDNGLRIVNIGDPAFPIEVGSLSMSGALWVHVEGTLAYVADSWWGLKVVDVSNPTAPILIGESYVYGQLEKVVPAGGYAYVSANRGDLQILDISTPSSPVGAGGLLYPDEGYDADLIGDYAYLSLGYEGDILVLDVSDPASPVEEIRFQTTGSAEALQPVGSYAYLAAGGRGLRVLDVSDPALPVDIGGADTPGWATDVAVFNDHVYVADGSGGLRVMDVSTPASPFEIGSTTTPAPALDIATDGTYAYLATYSSGVYVYWLNSPASANPQFVGFVNPPGNEYALALRDSHLFVVGNSGLRVIDVSNPAAPAEIAFYDAYINATDIVLQGPYAHLAAESRGILTFDVSDPSAPIPVDAMPLASTPIAIAAGRGRVLFTQEEIELEITSPCGLLMADDLETGDTRFWSNTAP